MSVGQVSEVANGGEIGQIDDLVGSEVEDGVGPVTVLEDEGVGTATAREDIIALAAIEKVIAIAAKEDVGTGPPEELVVV
ncbi:MAG: hypothetical protein AAFR30_03175, partial [Cyanobacteria bacterium J06628_4]